MTACRCCARPGQRGSAVLEWCLIMVGIGVPLAWALLTIAPLMQQRAAAQRAAELTARYAALAPQGEPMIPHDPIAMIEQDAGLEPGALHIELRMHHGNPGYVEATVAVEVKLFGAYGRGVTYQSVHRHRETLAPYGPNPLTARSPRVGGGPEWSVVDPYVASRSEIGS